MFSKYSHHIQYYSITDGMPIICFISLKLIWYVQQRQLHFGDKKYKYLDSIMVLVNAGAIYLVGCLLYMHCLLLWYSICTGNLLG